MGRPLRKINIELSVTELKQLRRILRETQYAGRQGNVLIHNPDYEIATKLLKKVKMPKKKTNVQLDYRFFGDPYTCGPEFFDGRNGKK